MFVQSISQKLSSALDELGRILDILHKFPQQQRKLYFEKIQSLKNQLMMMRNQLKQSNALQIERKYNTIYVNLSSLKSKIEDQNNMLINKQNRCTNYSRISRQSKSTHQDALRLLAEKEEQINSYKLTLFEKEELIKINFQELRDFKRQCGMLTEENKMMKGDLVHLEKELSILNQKFMNAQNEANDLRIEKQELERQVRIDGDALNRFSCDLKISREKLEHFEKLAEVSVLKTNIVEENIRRIQLQAESLNQNYKEREEEILRRDKIIHEYRAQSTLKDEKVDQLHKENDNLQKQLQNMESELSVLQKQLYELKLENREIKESYEHGRKQWNLTKDEFKLKENEKSEELEEYQNKFIELYNKNSELEEQKVLLKGKVEKFVASLEETKVNVQDLSTKIDSLERQNRILLEQKIALSETVNKNKFQLKEKDSKIFELTQKLKTKELQRVSLSHRLESCEAKIKQNEKNKSVLEKSQLALADEIAKSNNRIFFLEEKNRSCERTIFDLKKRLLKAKIEVIHEIRSEISE